MPENIENLSDEEIEERDKKMSETIDKLIQIGEKFMDTDDYKNSPLSDEYKSRIVRVFPIFVDTAMKGDMKEFLREVQHMDAGDAFVLGMLTGRLFFSMAKDRM